MGQVRYREVGKGLSVVRSNVSDPDEVAELAELVRTEHGVPQVLVERGSAALASGAAWWYRDPSRQLLTIGITGTNGKTTTAFLLRAILEHTRTPTGLMGTVRRIVG